MKPHDFRGIFTPLITPITPDETPDLESIDHLVRFQIESGVNGLWAMGTTSEFASFDERERSSVLTAIVRSVAGRVPIVANISDASTRMAIRHGQRAIEAGADAVAATPPYYYPHSQHEIIVHYRAIKAALEVPLYIYNIPQTVKVKLELSTARQLAQEGTIHGIKDSQNDLEWFRQFVHFVRVNGHPLRAFAGTRYLIDAAVMMGADGAIPSMANAFPQLCVSAYAAAQSGNFAESDRLESTIMEIEGCAGSMAMCSRNAAVIGLAKAVLHGRGIIAYPNLTRPLRTPDAMQREVLLQNVTRATGIAV